MKVGVGAVVDGVPNSLRWRLERVRERIANAARSCGREPRDVTLVGVSKKHSRDEVLASIEAGLTDVAESYVQEAREKLADLPPVRKHFVGHVQTNKAKAIVDAFDVVQSIDRLDAGIAIAKAARVAGKPVRTLLQLNISPAERFGVTPEDAPALATRLRDQEGLIIDGVMAIAPNTTDRAEIARAFARAARACAALGGTTLSLGMSGDLEEAIDCGSTMLRIGTAIFGART